MYGSQLWDQTSIGIENMYTQWRKAHRQILSLPYMTHCDILPLIADNMPLEYILDSRYFAFYKSIVNSKNKIISHTASSKIFDYSSPLGRNITQAKNQRTLSKQIDVWHKKWISNVCSNHKRYDNDERKQWYKDIHK